MLCVSNLPNMKKLPMHKVIFSTWWLERKSDLTRVLSMVRVRYTTLFTKTLAMGRAGKPRALLKPQSRDLNMCWGRKLPSSEKLAWESVDYRYDLESE